MISWLHPIECSQFHPLYYEVIMSAMASKNHQPDNCLLNRLFRRRSKEASRLRVTGLWEGISPVTGEFPVQRANNAENVSIWWRHHAASSNNNRYLKKLWLLRMQTICWGSGLGRCKLGHPLKKLFRITACCAVQKLCSVNIWYTVTHEMFLHSE